MAVIAISSLTMKDLPSGNQETIQVKASSSASFNIVSNCKGKLGVRLGGRGREVEEHLMFFLSVGLRRPCLSIFPSCWPSKVAEMLSWVVPLAFMLVVVNSSYSGAIFSWILCAFVYEW